MIFFYVICSFFFRDVIVVSSSLFVFYNKISIFDLLTAFHKVSRWKKEILETSYSVYLQSIDKSDDLNLSVPNISHKTGQHHDKHYQSLRKLERSTIKLDKFDTEDSVECVKVKFHLITRIFRIFKL